jgi:hypothetical protein
MKRLWIVLGALAVTLAALGIALFLGSLGFDYHRKVEHETLLRELLARRPTAAQLTDWLQRVKDAPLVASPATPEEREQVIARLGGSKAGEIRTKSARYPQMRVYRATDTLYFIFFDENGVMRDYTSVSR